ncbi:MAG: YitT family protein [Bacillota bacterium]|nr:YitT family protein [Bacillota bacterium]
MKKSTKEFLLMTMGSVMVAIGIYFFKLPNNFCTGGVSGISVLLGAFFKSISAGTFILLINTAMLLIGFVFVGKSFGLKTVYCTLLMSFLTYLLKYICPLDRPLTNEPLLELAFAIFLPGIGSAILFNMGASTGGTDIVAMIIKKYTSANISKSLFFADSIIVMLTVVVFGVETWLLSVVGFLAKVLVVNNVIESINTSKFFTIITDRDEEILRYITEELHKDATLSKDYEGAYTHKEKKVILTALNRRQAIELKRYIKTIDSDSFIIIFNTTDIIGRGFRECV